MKHILFIFIFAAISGSSAYSQSLQVLKEKNGFRNYKLGTNVKDYPELKVEYVHSKSDITYIWKRNIDFKVPSLKFGEAFVSEMGVKTFNNRIYEITIWFEQSCNEDLKGILNDAFGTDNEQSWEIDNIICEYYKYIEYAITFTDKAIEENAMKELKAQEKRAIDKF